MNKRKSSSEFQMFPNPKQVKLSDSCAELLNGIDFVDFDDEFTSSEGSTEDQSKSNNKQLVDNLLHGIDFDSLDEHDSSHLVDLSSWKRCVVDNCQRDGRNQDLFISGHEDNTISDSSKTDKKMICRLQHSWSQSRIKAGDIVSILAIWNAKLKSYCVTNTNGFVVVRPDFLVSGTTVVGGLFCMRKAVQQDRFKGIEAGIKIVSYTL